MAAFAVVRVRRAGGHGTSPTSSWHAATIEHRHHCLLRSDFSNRTRCSLSGPAPERFRSAALPRALAPLGYRNFALYWIGMVASNSGRWIELTGGVWLASELTASPALLGLLGAFRGVPTIILGPLAGVISDRVDQRRLLIGTQAAAIAASLALWMLVFTGSVQLWHIYVQVAVQAVIETFDAAGRQALFPRLVARTYRSEAVTLAAVAGRAAKFIGPSVGGLAIATLGVAAPFLLSAVTFLSLTAAVLLIRGIAPRTPIPGSSIRRELMVGARYVAGTPVVGGLLKMEAVFALFQVNAVIITIVGRQALDVGPEQLGGLLSAPALGGLLGLTYLLLFAPTRQGRLIVVCTSLYALGLVMFAVSGSYVISFAALAIVGLFDALITVTRASVIQLTTPGRMRGQVMSTTRMVTAGLSRLAQTQSGLMSSSLGGPLAVLSAAAILAASAGISAKLNRPLWRFVRETHAKVADIAQPVAEDSRPT